MSAKKGAIIVFEGIDGCGKTTQERNLFLSICMSVFKDGADIVSAHFPRDIETGKTIRNYLMSGKYTELDRYQMTWMYLTDMFEEWISNLKKKYDQGAMIILDRFWTSSMYMQLDRIGPYEQISNTNDKNQSDNEFLDWVTDVVDRIFHFPPIDLVLYLDQSIHTCMDRLAQRNEDESDAAERDFEYIKRAYENGQRIANREGWTIIKGDTEIVPGYTEPRSETAIAEEILEIVCDKFGIFREDF